MNVVAIILAAGKGTRMKSRLPKVLHVVCGIPMLEHVVESARAAGVKRNIVVIGHGSDNVRQTLSSKIEWVVQSEQLGTGHAVIQAAPLLSDSDGHVLVLCGDTPLITAETLARLVKEHYEMGNTGTIITADAANPSGYGRIVRDSTGVVKEIVEHKDASEEQLKIKEINTGIYCFKIKQLFSALEKITPANAQGEYYLTDVLSVLAGSGGQIGAVKVDDTREIMGINDRIQLAEAEKIMRRRILNRHMAAGVTVIDPDNTYIGNEVSLGPDSVVYPGTIIEGKCCFGEDCQIGPYSRVKNVKAGNQVTVQNSMVVDSTVGSNVIVGPFAYIRPGTVLEDDVKVGDFVEIKNSMIAKGSKVPHLSYVGDTHIGESVNIGAGTITCNYDGTNKWKTTIGNNAFIGSNTNLVAPVKVGENAIIGAGSTVTKNVPDGALCLERGKQKVYPDWITRKNKKK